MKKITQDNGIKWERKKSLFAGSWPTRKCFPVEHNNFVVHQREIRSLCDHDGKKIKTKTTVKSSLSIDKPSTLCKPLI